jgi:hypothetical protein
MMTEEIIEAAPVAKKTRKIVPDAEFVMAWQKASNPQEVADKFGLQRASVNARACGLRLKGVRLKKFPRAPAFGRQPRDESYYADLMALAEQNGDLCPVDEMPTDEASEDSN